MKHNDRLLWDYDSATTAAYFCVDASGRGGGGGVRGSGAGGAHRSRHSSPHGPDASGPSHPPPGLGVPTDRVGDVVELMDLAHLDSLATSTAPPPPLVPRTDLTDDPAAAGEGEFEVEGRVRPLLPP